MKKILFVALAALGLSACDSEPKFKVEVLFLWILSS